VADLRLPTQRAQSGAGSDHAGAALAQVRLAGPSPKPEFVGPAGQAHAGADERRLALAMVAVAVAVPLTVGPHPVLRLGTRRLDLVEHLRGRVDLVVVAALREGGQLVQVFGELRPPPLADEQSRSRSSRSARACSQRSGDSPDATGVAFGVRVGPLRLGEPKTPAAGTGFLESDPFRTLGGALSSSLLANPAPLSAELGMPRPRAKRHCSKVQRKFRLFVMPGPRVRVCAARGQALCRASMETARRVP
jgi:hypothetical protein